MQRVPVSQILFMQNKNNSKLKKEKKPKKVKQDKKALVCKLVDLPKNARTEFLIQEYVALNLLLKTYSFDFLNQIELEYKLQSLRILFSDYYKDLLQRKLVAWHYKSDYSGFNPQEIKTEPVDDFIMIKRNKTLKQFLNES